MTEERLQTINKTVNELRDLKGFLSSGNMSATFILKTSKKIGNINDDVGFCCSPAVRDEIIQIIRSRVEILTHEFEAL